MAREHQGIAASLVNTAVNYSISIGLGMAGTVETHVNDGGVNLLKGYRGAWYLGIGLGTLGIAVSVCFILFGSHKGKADGPDRSDSGTEEELQSQATV
jgi:hypothetical protein